MKFPETSHHHLGPFPALPFDKKVHCQNRSPKPALLAEGAACTVAAWRSAIQESTWGRSISEQKLCLRPENDMSYGSKFKTVVPKRYLEIAGIYGCWFPDFPKTWQFVGFDPSPYVLMGNRNHFVGWDHVKHKMYFDTTKENKQTEMGWIGVNLPRPMQRAKATERSAAWYLAATLNSRGRNSPSSKFSSAKFWGSTQFLIKPKLVNPESNSSGWS